MNPRKYAALILLELYAWLSLSSHLVGERQWHDWVFAAVNVGSIAMARWFRRRARVADDARR